MSLWNRLLTLFGKKGPRSDLEHKPNNPAGPGRISAKNASGDSAAAALVPASPTNTAHSEPPPAVTGFRPTGGRAMTRDEIRRTFSAFAGRQRYQRWLDAIDTTCQRKDRLMYWQEQLWEEYMACAPGTIPTTFQFIEIEEHFRICHWHATELIPVEGVAVMKGEIDDPELKYLESTRKRGYYCKVCREQYATAAAKRRAEPQTPEEAVEALVALYEGRQGFITGSAAVLPVRDIARCLDRRGGFQLCATSMRPSPRTDLTRPGIWRWCGTALADGRARSAVYLAMPPN